MRMKTKELDPPPGTFKADTKPSDPPDLAHLIRRFDPDRRVSVRRLVNSSPRAADLAIVFPGALYAISDSNGSIDIRRRALDLVLEGAALRDVAQVLNLPLWLRRLPPEAFTGSIGPLPASEMFSRRIVNQLPTAAENSAFWLKAVSFGAYACDEYFALWLARQPVYSNPEIRLGCSVCSRRMRGIPRPSFPARMASSWCRGAQKCRSIQQYARPRAGSTAYGSCCSWDLAPSPIPGSRPEKRKTSRSCRCSSRRRSWLNRGPCRIVRISMRIGWRAISAGFSPVRRRGVRVATLEDWPACARNRRSGHQSAQGATQHAGVGGNLAGRAHVGSERRRI